MNVELTQEEALVLFEWLHRMSESSSTVFEDQAEQRALWNVVAVLEAQLTAIVDPRYRELLAEARDRLRDAEE